MTQSAQPESLFDRPYFLSIGGSLIETDEQAEVINPATGKLLARVPVATTEHLDAAVAAAKEAFPAWSRLSYDQREALLNQYADALERHRLPLMRLLTQEQGKPLKTISTFEVEAAIQWVRQIAARRLPVEIVEETERHTVELQQVPLGVVGAITPWNFPLIIAIAKIVPALITGNTIVLKPSPFTPLCTLRLGEIAQAIFPAGVVNVLSGGNELGAQLTSHPDIAKISFTGSTATGKRVVQSAAETVKRVTLELGGNDAAIVLPDADWKSILPELFWGAIANSGQWCVGIKRLYVHRSVKDEFINAFVEYAKQQKVGNGLDEDVVIGPVQNKMQFSKVQELLKDIKANRYKVVLGGEVGDGSEGYFVPVTVIDNPPEEARIVQEEQFSPLVPILAYDEVDEVIRRANASPFGLGGSVWGDTERAIEVANQLETGTVWVNEIHQMSSHMPFGGHKQSGLGLEHGVEGLRLLTNPKVIAVKK